MNPEDIRNYWTRQAEQYGASPAASWSDSHAIDLEISEIARRLDDGDRVLDVGCANGYSTLEYAARKRLTIRGVDYVPRMIEEARGRLAEARPISKSSVEFTVGDALGLDEPAGAYDKVIVVRVLINLGDWDTQQRAIRECARVVRPGGLLLLSEATLQGWHRLNAMRAEWQLSAIPMPAFNTYLDEQRVVAAAAPDLAFVELVNFSSSYFVLTRIVKPLLARVAGTEDRVADPQTEWNRWAAQFPPCGDYGTQKLFVFRKR